MASQTLSSSGAGKVILDDRYETLVQLSPDALYVLQDDRLVFINAAGARQLRAGRPEELIGVPVSDIIHQVFIERVRERMTQMFDTGEPVPSMEQQYLRRDGSVIDVEVCSAPFLYEGKPAIQVIARDITDRKAVQEALRVSDDLHRTLAREANRAKELLQHEKTILEMIALDKPLPEVLRRVCLGTEELLQDGARCSVVLLDPAGSHLRVAAAPSLPETYNAAINGLTIGPEVGSCGTAIYSNEPVIVEDIAHSPLWNRFRTLAQVHDMQACWSRPIRSASGSVIGAIAIYYPTPHEPSAEDYALIDDVARLAGVALQKDKVERSLQESEDRYRSVVTSLTEGIVVQSREGVVLAGNPSAARILRLTHEQMVGLRRGSYFKRVFDENGVSLADVELPSEKVLRTGQAILNLVIGIEMMDGEIIWLSENVLPIHTAGETEPRAVVISFSDISAAKETQQRLKFMATHDALTGLPNRSFLSERLSESLLRAEKNGEHVAILFLDLDRFKNVNDMIGHEAGDRLLQVVADRLSSCISVGDVLARLGGDEFMVLVQGFADTAYLMQLSERILLAVSDIFRVEDNEYYLGVSIGISVFPDDGKDGPTLLRCADSAMYHAKESGRNNYKFFTAEINAHTQRRYLLEKNLRRALSRREFRLYYQPKVELLTGRVVGAEALLRWDNPAAGMVPPSDFIPIAEDAGLIVPIGQWVLEQACRQAAQWRNSVMPDLRIAVNLSPRQFQDEHLVDVVRDILRRSGLPAHALEFEITESLLMGDTEKLMPVFDALTGLGVRFSIDDFGTGYSSLSYLQRFPISNLKIDRSFISGIPGERDSIALTQAIIAMAKALDMTITAEGVEQKDQMTFLKEAGCQEIQGFFFSAPVTAEAFARLIS
jgi:diguanylate cyclase (GGDEF)-like protein/PAS domain S-box-containing protein